MSEPFSCASSMAVFVNGKKIQQQEEDMKEDDKWVIRVILY